MSGSYVLRRLLIAVPSLLGISIVLFTVLALAPGDPFGELTTNPNVPPEVQAALRASLGLDDPIWLRYLHWLTALLKGNWGYSFVSRIDVGHLILQRVPVTLAVIGAAQLLAILVAVPVGTLAAMRPYSVFDQLANTVAFIGFSLPTFFTGLLLILFFSVKLGWLPFVFQADIAASGLDWWWAQIRQSLMPVAVLGLFQGASLVRYVRASVLDVNKLDYVTTARAKGIGARRVVLRHVLRNALIPVTTLVALQLPAVFGGAIVTEQIFRIPGIGSLLIASVLANDTPVVMGVTIVFATLVILCNILADLLYGLLDPRITLR
ncbi:Dipeptide transport system permease protein DppB [Roseomonas sp. TAS13]|uniref:ABC transporter permease n=1 Tax=Roseomonas sp. TAS13 TaxID=1926319 RepID=UPI00095F21A3|nr:ABC transporter permease [Roseomonas sp. TAS13]USQ74198.1 ABC transporter permease [Roseomonas mucosa]GAV34824.1 Dipeptide transport system permease protein DppB [Roseomonas sp. TAS13]